MDCGSMQAACLAAAFCQVINIGMDGAVQKIMAEVSCKIGQKNRAAWLIVVGRCIIFEKCKCLRDFFLVQNTAVFMNGVRMRQRLPEKEKVRALRAKGKDAGMAVDRVSKGLGQLVFHLLAK